MYENEIVFLIFACSATFALISIGFVTLMYFFNKAKRKHLIDQKEKELYFLNEIHNVKTEIQRDTLNAISSDLHDNIGQLLSYTKIHIQQLNKTHPSAKLNEIKSVISEAIAEVRSISKTLRVEDLATFKLTDALETESLRINKFEGISATFKAGQINGSLSKDTEIIIFRIAQEFLNNSLKHSRANEVLISLEDQHSSLVMELSDNGIGFNSESQNYAQGSGHKSMYSRAKLINAKLTLESIENVGTSLILNIPNKLYE